ncbi:MAG TPA: S8 family serine peptidase, partial [Verrucomicrobiae bacterium]
IQAADGTIISYIPNNAYLVKISAGGAGLLGSNYRVQSVLPYEPYYKVQASLLGLALAQKPLPANTYLTLGLVGDANTAITAVKQTGAKVLDQDRSPFGTLVHVKPGPDWVALANLPQVLLVEQAYRRQAANDLSRVAVGITTNTTDGITNNYLGLTGKNVMVEVNDTGIDAKHPDFDLTVGGTGNPRVAYDAIESTSDTDGHGTHVAGIIAGNGSKSSTVTNASGSVTNADFRGKAPNAWLFSVGGIDGGNDTNNVVDDSYLQSAPALTNALISNNSWTYGNAEYDLAAASYDAAVRDALPERTGPQPVLFVFAAGNVGGGNDSGLGGTADTVTSPGSAKNVITVGALEQLRNITNIVTALDGTSNALWAAETDTGFQVAGYSSRGNVGVQTEGDFGRFKPDVVAPGTFVLSTRSSMWDTNSYFSNTNYYENIVFDSALSNAPAYGFITVPQNAIKVTIQVLQYNTAGLFTNFPVYVSAVGVPDPTDPSTYELVKSNGWVSIPPDTGINISDIQNSALIYAVADYTNTVQSFYVVETVVTTNDLGNELDVLHALDDGLGAPPPYYRYESGTSMAAPAVSGVLALVQDYFTNTLATTPSPALLKAMLINGARLTGGYDYAVTNVINYEGWGLVNLPNTLPSGLTNSAAAGTNGVSSIFLDQSPTNFVATGDRRTWNLSLASTAARLQPMHITLA